MISEPEFDYGHGYRGEEKSCPRCSRLTVEGLAEVIAVILRGEPKRITVIDTTLAQAILDYLEGRKG
ncbi:MAG: hypothetical protein ACWGQW_00945 [bacterium]